MSDALGLYITFNMLRNETATCKYSISSVALSRNRLVICSCCVCIVSRRFSRPRFTCARFDYENDVQVFRLRTCTFS